MKNIYELLYIYFLGDHSDIGGGDHCKDNHSSKKRLKKVNAKSF